MAGTASDNTALAKVEVRIDGGAFQLATGLSSWTFGVDTTVLSNGAHTLTARATDTANNTAVASVSVMVSNAAPDAAPSISIAAPPAGATLSGLATITGTSADDIGVAAVHVSVDGGAFAAATGTSSWSFSIDTKTLSNAAHTVTARATDTAGHTAVASRSFSVSNMVVSPPSLSLSVDAPAAGATVSGLFNVAGSVTGAARLDVRFDSLAYISVPVASTWSHTFDSSALANGAHTLSVVAEDAAGSSVTRQVSFTASNTNVPPELSIQTPAQGASVSGLVKVVGFAYDTNGVGQTEVSLDGGAYVLTTGYSRWSLDLDTAPLARGTHTLRARVKDDPGAVSIADVSFQVVGSDVTPPGLAISWPLSGASLSNAVTFSGTASDETALARVEVAVDGSAFYRPATGTTSWTYALDTRGLANGSHTFAVRAVDTAGNVKASQVSATVSNGHSSETLVLPEGATIKIDSDAGWSAQAIAAMLKVHARDLDVIGPSLTVQVDDLSGASTQVSCASGQACSALMHLGSGPNSSFALMPDEVLAHEYGHVWTLWHLHVSQDDDWTSYLVYRGLDADPRLDSTYPTWDRRELIADDYKEILAGEAARGFTRRSVRHPLSMSSFSDFFLNVWAK